VSEKRDRWFVKAVMFVGLLAFLGLSVFPIVNAFQTERTPEAASPSPNSNGQEQADLEAQERGYELVVQREPDNEAALRGLLEVRLRQNKIEGAIEPLEKLAELNPEETRYQVLLAQAKQQVGDREGAAGTYRSILKENPGNQYALEGLTNLLLQQNRPEAAIGLLQDTLKIAPQTNQVKPGSVDTGSIRLLLAGIYAQQQRYQEAIAVYDNAIEASDDDDFRPILGKGMVLQQQGKTDAAQSLFDRALEMAPPQYKDQIQAEIEQLQTQSPSAPSENPPAATEGTEESEAEN
jgi:tetratricopeptide (TPR) repeat protein